MNDENNHFNDMFCFSYTYKYNVSVRCTSGFMCMIDFYK